MDSEEGKKAKADHLDWHFRTNQRLAESVQRGLSRSWYVDEFVSKSLAVSAFSDITKEWIKFREQGGEARAGSPEKGQDPLLLGPNFRKDDPKAKFVPVPGDNAIANTPCPICQDRFEVSRNEEIQDFVWVDAVKIGGRIYHASCYADLKKDGGNSPARTATPDSVLGKRKAEVCCTYLKTSSILT